jgi:hypothetical protein
VSHAKRDNRGDCRVSLCYGYTHISLAEITLAPVHKSLYLFNWRQLQGWTIRHANVPGGNIASHRGFSIWSLYKWHIIGIASLVKVT